MQTVDEVKAGFTEADQIAVARVHMVIKKMQAGLSELLLLKEDATNIKFHAAKTVLSGLLGMLTSSTCAHCIYAMGVIGYGKCDICVWSKVHGDCCSDASLYDRLYRAVDTACIISYGYRLEMNDQRFAELANLVNTQEAENETNND